MPRDSTGAYTLPNFAFVPGTTIRASEVNGNFQDVAQALTESLPRDGSVGMANPLGLPNGSITLPSLNFSNDSGMGLWRPVDGAMELIRASTSLQRWTLTAVTIYPACTIDDTLTVTGAVTLNSTLSVEGNTTLGNAVSDTTAVAGPLTVGSTAAVTGVLTTSAGSETFGLKPGTVDHTYMGFYARTASPSTRSGYFGYPSAGTSGIELVNSLSGGNITLTPGSGGRVIIPRDSDQTPTIGSGFTTSQTVKYYRTSSSEVQITGSVTCTASGASAVVFNLPAGYRPSASLVFACIRQTGGSGGGNIATIEVGTGGDVTIYSQASGERYSFNNIRFPV